MTAINAIKMKTAIILKVFLSSFLCVNVFTVKKEKEKSKIYLYIITLPLDNITVITTRINEGNNCVNLTLPKNNNIDNNDIVAIIPG